MESSSRIGADDAEFAARLLEVVRTLTLELWPASGRKRVELDTNLDRELGFDSLSRVELLLRLESEFDARLPEQVYSAAETPRDLLRALLSARPRSAHPRVEAVVEPVLGVADQVPTSVNTLPAVLEWRATQQSERTHVLLYEADAETPVSISFADLQTGAERVAVGLGAWGIEPGQAVAMMLPTSRAYLECFFGVLLAGAIPVPIYPPLRPSQLEDHLRRHALILANADARVLVTVPEAKAVSRLLINQVECLTGVVTPDELSAASGLYRRLAVAPDDIALLQYTSGSTGQPKGVVLTHEHLLTNIHTIGEWVQASSDDVFVSWLPLYHDMGLIGAWLGSLYYAMLTVLMPPTAFLTRPWRWLRAMHEHGGTISAAPNFAYELCLSKIPDVELEGLDLSTWRLAINGAEPVSPNTVRRFGSRFARYGFDAAAMTPVYGLAECAVGLAFPPLDRGPLIDRIDRDAFEHAGRAEPAGTEIAKALEFVACGRPLPGYQIRIVDPAGKELPDRQEGRLEFQGPSATAGYRGNATATAQLFDGDWLDSGDLAYMSGGDVYLTSRVKDLIIRGGRNIYPYELEEAVGDLPEVRKGCVAVFGSGIGRSDVEQLVVVAETRLTDGRVLADVRARIGAAATDLLGIAPDEVLLVPPRTVLKTSSGKIRRSACRALYEEGRIGEGPRAVWWQLVRLRLSGLRIQWRRAARVLRSIAFAGYAYLMLALTAPVATAALALLPSVAIRWRAARAVARLLLRLVRVPVLIQGSEHVPPANAQCVLVANHSSYLDGLVLLCVMPDPVAFVAKGELRQNWFARWFLTRLGAQFVERFDVAQGTADARYLAAHAREGAPLLFFPEGRFTRYPGLLPFHMGAFSTAAENGLRLVPITIRGTRSALRGSSGFPRPGTVAVVVGEPLVPSGRDWQAALDLRNAARAEILRHSGEPDLMLDAVT